MTDVAHRGDSGLSLHRGLLRATHRMELCLLPVVSAWEDVYVAAFVRLFLVRHAEALANPDLRYLGSRDDPLTERGQWQATQLALAFADVQADGRLHESPDTGAGDGDPTGSGAPPFSHS